jgi:hypothetical protein
MRASDHQGSGGTGMSLEIVWRNSHPLVQAHLKARQASNPYCRWAEQARKIRTPRSKWDANHM